MRQQLILACPTRSRPELAKALCNSFLQRPHDNSKLVLVVPSEQADLYGTIEGIDILHHPLLGITGIVPPANYAAPILSSQCDTIGLVGDDSLIRTDNWEQRVLESQKSHWLCYTNDLHQGDRLVGTMFLKSSVIKTLGWFYPPCFTQLYADNVWTEVVKRLGGHEYLGDVIFEHMHPAAGKRTMDELTAAMNTLEQYGRGRSAYNEYMESSFSRDAATIAGVITLNK